METIQNQRSYGKNSHPNVGDQYFLRKSWRVLNISIKKATRIEPSRHNLRMIYLDNTIAHPKIPLTPNH